MDISKLLHKDAESKTRSSLYLPEELYLIIKKLADEHGLSWNDCAVRVLEYGVVKLIELGSTDNAQ